MTLKILGAKTLPFAVGGASNCKNALQQMANETGSGGGGGATGRGRVAHTHVVWLPHPVAVLFVMSYHAEGIECRQRRD